MGHPIYYEHVIHLLFVVRITEFVFKKALFHENNEMIHGFSSPRQFRQNTAWLPSYWGLK